MTFAWTEMYFLSKWWKTAIVEQKENLKKLIAEKRFEVLTGGWVMTDEATVHIYSMLDQLIEGLFVACFRDSKVFQKIFKNPFSFFY